MNTPTPDMWTTRRHARTAFKRGRRKQTATCTRLGCHRPTGAVLTMYVPSLRTPSTRPCLLVLSTPTTAGCSCCAPASGTAKTNHHEEHDVSDTTTTVSSAAALDSEHVASALDEAGDYHLVATD